jgi:hypothetical protein
MALTGVKRIEELAALAEDGEYFDIYVFASLVQADEREACAKVAEDMDAAVLALLNVTRQPIAIAARIRARGKSDKQD